MASLVLTDSSQLTSDSQHLACFRRVMAGKRVLEHFVRRSLPAHTVNECQKECSKEAHFTCEGFNFRLLLIDTLLPDEDGEDDEGQVIARQDMTSNHDNYEVTDPVTHDEIIRLVAEMKNKAPEPDWIRVEVLQQISEQGVLKRNPRVKIDGQTIRRSKDTRYLGVMLDEKCDFMTHVENTCRKALRTMNKIINRGTCDCDRKATPEHVVLECIETLEDRMNLQIPLQASTVYHILRDVDRWSLLNAITDNVSKYERDKRRNQPLTHRVQPTWRQVCDAELELSGIWSVHQSIGWLLSVQKMDRKWSEISGRVPPQVVRRVMPTPTGALVDLGTIRSRLANALVVLSSTAEDGEIEVRILVGIDLAGFGRGSCQLVDTPTSQFDIGFDFLSDQDYDFYEWDRTGGPDCRPGPPGSREPPHNWASGGEKPMDKGDFMGTEAVLGEFMDTGATLGEFMGTGETLEGVVGMVEVLVEVMGIGEDLEEVMVKEEDLGEVMGMGEDLGEVMVKEDLGGVMDMGADLGEVMVKEEDLEEVMGMGVDLGEVMVKEEDLGEVMGMEADLGEVMVKEEDLGEVMVKEEDLGEVMVKEEDLGEVMGKEVILA
uniref:Uncharacterized protein n=1 Tax=Timema shepardi TaxID=629360 RepID=A0A7R9AZP6_TIMSH|nr:unnamed protein product [Timema shepardi]